MSKLQQCHNCGGEFPDEAMADWTVCRGCMIRETEEARGEPVFMDQLGICWTQDELKEAGGKEEVERLAANADARGKYN